MQRWEQEVDEILRKQFSDGDSNPLPVPGKRANDILNLLLVAGSPSGDLGEIIPEVIKLASQPLTAKAGELVPTQLPRRKGETIGTLTDALREM